MNAVNARQLTALGQQEPVRDHSSSNPMTNDVMDVTMTGHLLLIERSPTPTLTHPDDYVDDYDDLLTQQPQ